MGKQRRKWVDVHRPWVLNVSVIWPSSSSHMWHVPESGSLTAILDVGQEPASTETSVRGEWP
jgi:hypothetical protein